MLVQESPITIISLNWLFREKGREMQNNIIISLSKFWLSNEFNEEYHQVFRLIGVIDSLFDFWSSVIKFFASGWPSVAIVFQRSDIEAVRTHAPLGRDGRLAHAPGWV